MIIYGIGSTRLASENIMVSCLSCQAQNSLQLTIVQQYAHLFWIPFFPTDKKSATQCVHCGAVVPREEFTLAFKPENERVKSHAKTPWWTYSGLMLVALFFLSGFITSRIDRTENAELILKPQKGDLYQIKLSYKEYSLYKVDRLEGNMVYLFENQYSVDQEKGIDELKDKPFNEISTPVPLRSLKAMLENKEILDVERP